MASATFLLLVVALASFAFLTVLSSRRSLPKGSRYPLGPPGKPLVGNLPDVSTTSPSAKLAGRKLVRASHANCGLSPKDSTQTLMVAVQGMGGSIRAADALDSSWEEPLCHLNREDCK
jgi:hypothetical protein